MRSKLYKTPKPRPTRKYKVLLKGGPADGQTMPLHLYGTLTFTWGAFTGHYEVDQHTLIAEWKEE